MNSYTGLEHITCLISTNYYQGKKHAKLQVSFFKFPLLRIIGHENNLRNLVALSFMISSHCGCFFMFITWNPILVEGHLQVT